MAAAGVSIKAFCLWGSLGGMKYDNVNRRDLMICRGCVKNYLGCGG